MGRATREEANKCKATLAGAPGLLRASTGLTSFGGSVAKRERNSPQLARYALALRLYSPGFGASAVAGATVCTEQGAIGSDGGGPEISGRSHPTKIRRPEMEWTP